MVVFPPLYVNMVGAGEQSGALETVLNRLTEYTEAQVALRGKIVTTHYPALMGGVSGLIIIGLFVGVIPRIRRIFESMDAALPTITQVVMQSLTSARLLDAFAIRLHRHGLVSGPGFKPTKAD